MLFGGFPWNLIGYAFAGSDAMVQLAALTGVWGLSLLAVLAGALPAALLEPGGRRRWQPRRGGRPDAAAALVRRRAAARGERSAGRPAPLLRLVQGNVAQHHKWQPELRAQWFRRHLELSAQAADGVQAVIWPESATPYALDQEPEARRLIGEVVPPGGLLLTGGERFDFASEPARAWNSLFVLDAGRHRRRALRQARPRAVRRVPAAARRARPPRARQAHRRQRRLPGRPRSRRPSRCRACRRSAR